MSDQRDTLGYAACLKARGFEAEAAELRRLAAENALLHERHRFDNGVLKELLEALKAVCTHAPRSSQQIEADWNRARATIVKVEGAKL
jgi:hypothetical protein